MLKDSTFSTVDSAWSEGNFDVVAAVDGPAYSSGDYYVNGDHYYWGYEPWWGWNYDGWTSYNFWSPGATPAAFYTDPWLSGRSYTITINGYGFTESPTTSGCNGGQYNIDWSVTATEIHGSAWLSSVLSPCQLEISVQGYTVASIRMDLSIPDGEESFAMGQFDMAGDFGARVTPDAATVRFLGRQVQEAVTMRDYCYFVGSEIAQLPDTFHNSSWTAQITNYYAGTAGWIDRIGLTGGGSYAWVAYYAQYSPSHPPYSCSVSGSQTMYIDGVTPYETHDSGLYVYQTGAVFAVRGNAVQNIYW